MGVRYIFYLGVKEITLFDEDPNWVTGNPEKDRLINKRVISISRPYILNIVGKISEYRIPKIHLTMRDQVYEGYMAMGFDSITIEVDNDIFDGRFNQ